MSSSSPFVGYFDSNVALLKFSGLWVYDSHTNWRKRYGQFAYNIFWAVYLYFIYFPTECMYLSVVYNDLSGFIRVLRDMGNHMALIVKAINWYVMRKQILALVKTLEETNCDYEEYADFIPKDIVASHKAVAAKWAKILFNLINLICFCMLASGLFVYIFAYKSQYEIVNGKQVYRQRLPVNVISPFGNETRPQFLVTFFYVVMALTFYGWMISALDALFTTLMSCMSAHLRILQGAIRTIRLRCKARIQFFQEESSYSQLMLHKQLLKEINICIRHLQVLLRASEKLEDIYNIQTLCQTLISLGEICFCLYLLSITLDESTGNEITYLFSTSFQLLLYCWFGNMVTDASIAVKYAFYESDWLMTNIQFRKEMILTMIRLQRPIHVTIGKITPLTFSTFLTIARGAYSFFTFLKQRNLRDLYQ